MILREHNGMRYDHFYSNIVGDTLDTAWLALLMDSRFHGALCGLFARAAFLLQLLEVSDDLRPICDPLTLRRNIQEVHDLLSQNGVQLPSIFTAALKGDLSV